MSTTSPPKRRSTAKKPPFHALSCKRCEHEIAEVSPDGNELRMICGSTNYPFNIKCPWCHAQHKWRPSRLAPPPTPRLGNSERNVLQ